MLLTAGGFMSYFWWKGWLGSQAFGAPRDHRGQDR
jgi:hypothetical protein